MLHNRTACVRPHSFVAPQGAPPDNLSVASALVGSRDPAQPTMPDRIAPRSGTQSRSSIVANAPGRAHRMLRIGSYRRGLLVQSLSPRLAHWSYGRLPRSRRSLAARVTSSPAPSSVTSCSHARRFTRRSCVLLLVIALAGCIGAASASASSGAINITYIGHSDARFDFVCSSKHINIDIHAHKDGLPMVKPYATVSGDGVSGGYDTFKGTSNDADFRVRLAVPDQAAHDTYKLHVTVQNGAFPGMAQTDYDMPAWKPEASWKSSRNGCYTTHGLLAAGVVAAAITALPTIVSWGLRQRLRANGRCQGGVGWSHCSVDRISCLGGRRPAQSELHRPRISGPSPLPAASRRTHPSAAKRPDRHHDHDS